MREFTQMHAYKLYFLMLKWILCANLGSDFDIAGVYDPMIPDSEILRIIVEVAQALTLDIAIKLNHGRILDGLFTVAGVPRDKIRSISSSIDKRDEAPGRKVSSYGVLHLY